MNTVQAPPPDPEPAGPPLWSAPAITGTALVLALLVAAMVRALDGGLTSPLLAVLGLLVCVACAMAGWRSGLYVVAAAALGLFAIALPQGSATPAAQPGGSALPLLGQLTVLALGMLAGMLVSRPLAREPTTGRDSEARFNSLLAMATDAYWEVDDEYRLVAITPQNPQDGAGRCADALGAMPWANPQFSCDTATMNQLLADLEGRQAFRGRPINWTSGSGRSRKLLVSGEPRFDQHGAFAGYWGVSRDVTDKAEARAEVLAAETRYQDLFLHLPTPLVLHRDLLVIDANPAAVQLLGYKDPQDMRGCDLLPHFEDANDRKRVRERLDELLLRRRGTALAFAEFRLLVQGRSLTVRSTGVRVEAAGGPALLSIFVDDTQRLAAEDLVRRSETMLLQLMASSPDLIMLLDAGTGRVVMVNPAFQRMFGAPDLQVLGRTPAELQLWADSGLEQRLTRDLLNTGTLGEQAVVLQSSTGQALPLRLWATRLARDKGDYLVFQAQDISQLPQELVRK